MASSGSRRLSVTSQPNPIPDLPPNVNQDGIMGQGDWVMEFSSVSVAGTYFQSSVNPFKDSKKYKTNQDSFFVVEDFQGPAVHYVGVLDGHGATGHFASQFIAKQLPIVFAKKAHMFDSNLNAAFVMAYDEVDQQLADSDIDVTLSGSTCTTCLFRNGEIVVSNCGDSRCVLGYVEGSQWRSKDLSNDHKPDLPEEQKRIEGMNGRVAPLDSWLEGPKRVWMRNEDIPGLAMSRSLGDRLAHSIGVSSEPEIIRHKLDKAKDRFMIVASDGVWEFISSAKAVAIVSSKDGPRAAAEALCREAVDRWQAEEPVCDDITAMVIFFKKS